MARKKSEYPKAPSTGVRPLRPRARKRVTEEQDHEALREIGRIERRQSLRQMAVVEAAVADGKTPLHVMMENMRYFQDKAEAQLVEASKLSKDHPRRDALMHFSEKDRLTASGLAKEAAPYVHPKLAAIEVNGNESGGVDALMALPGEERRRQIEGILERIGPLRSPGAGVALTGYRRTA